MSAGPADADAMLVVIVNYRTPELSIDCLRSLRDEVQGSPGLRVTVVDNASADGSADRIAAAIEGEGWGWATLVRSPVNGGFAAGNNRAIAAALDAQGPPDLFWLLNPDTRVQPGAAAALASFMRAHPRCGVAGSALLEEDGRAWPFAFRFPSVLGEVERGARLAPVSRLLARHATIRRMGAVVERVDWVSGASCVIRRAVIEEVGRFDEDYFLYFEETDFCLRARRAGWECWYVPQAAVLHIAGRATGVTGKQERPSRLPRYWFESRRRYFEKNHGRAYAILTDLAWAGAHLTWLVRAAFRRRPTAGDDPPALLRDFVRNSSMMPRRTTPETRPAR